LKGLGTALIVGLACLGVAGCGSDGGTTYVLQSESPSGSPSASPSLTNGSPASSSLPTTAATPIPNNFKIIIDSPDGGTAISSPVEVAGTASVDKGTVVAVVLDAGGAELGRATTTASAVKPEFGHFSVSVSFSGAVSGQKGQLKVFGVSPRDGTTPTSYYFISVRFA
jgi:immunoglobulin-like protein involved in spore germination